MLNMLAHEFGILRPPTHPQAWTFACPRAKLNLKLCKTSNKLKWWKERKWTHTKRMKLKIVFLFSKNLNPFSSCETFGAFLFLFFLFKFSHLSFSLLRLIIRRCSGILKKFEEKTFQTLFLMELHYEYEIGELWNYWQWMHTPEWTYARPYFWVRLEANFYEGKINLKRFQNSKRTHSLKKLNLSKSFYVDKYLALVGMYMILRNLCQIIQLRVNFILKA